METRKDWVWVLVNGFPETQICCMFGAAVRRLISAGSRIKLFLISSLDTLSIMTVWGGGGGKYVTRFRAPRSIPAREVIRLSRRIRVVIAGKELRFRPCSFSIMLPAKLNDRRQYNEDKTDGISINRFSDKSRESRFGASEVHAEADKV